MDDDGLRYGTVPIVHRTGGLADTVHGHNGFAVRHFDENGLCWALGRALSVWGTPEWKRPEQNGMAGRYGWNERGAAYEQIYRMVAPGRYLRSRLQQNGMSGHYGWNERVTAYEQIYRMIAPHR